MKKALLLAPLVCFLSLSSAIGEDLKSLDRIETIVCHGEGITYKDAPEMKPRPEHRSIFIFRNNHRKDKQRGQKFLLDEYYVEDIKSEDLDYFGNQIFYFQIKNTTLKFAFIADWKASGEMTVSKNRAGDLVSKGAIDQKGRATNLKCLLK